MHHLASLSIAAGMAGSVMMKNQPTSPTAAEECGKGVAVTCLGGVAAGSF